MAQHPLSAQYLGLPETKVRGHGEGTWDGGGARVMLQGQVRATRRLVHSSMEAAGLIRYLVSWVQKT